MREQVIAMMPGFEHSESESILFNEILTPDYRVDVCVGYEHS